MGFGRDDQNVQRRYVCHPARERLGDLWRAGELVLDIDEAIGYIDGGQE
jgi:hypothetical protein